jgi:hypothetical protein
MGKRGVKLTSACPARHVPRNRELSSRSWVGAGSHPGNGHRGGVRASLPGDVLNIRQSPPATQIRWSGRCDRFDDLHRGEVALAATQQQPAARQEVVIARSVTLVGHPGVVDVRPTFGDGSPSR